MATRFASAFGLISLLASPAGAELPELRNFECNATVGQEHYHLLLSRTDTTAHMQGRTETATIADGPAISYRSGTRYFVPDRREHGHQAHDRSRSSAHLLRRQRHGLSYVRSSEPRRALRSR
jgi:hypothetical protein